jgi:hypothetical protein
MRGSRAAAEESKLSKTENVSDVSEKRFCLHFESHLVLKGLPNTQTEPFPVLLIRALFPQLNEHPQFRIRWFRCTSWTSNGHNVVGFTMSSQSPPLLPPEVPCGWPIEGVLPNRFPLPPAASARLLLQQRMFPAAEHLASLGFCDKTAPCLTPPLAVHRRGSSRLRTLKAPRPPSLPPPLIAATGPCLLTLAPLASDALVLFLPQELLLQVLLNPPYPATVLKSPAGIPSCTRAPHASAELNLKNSRALIPSPHSLIFALSSAGGGIVGTLKSLPQDAPPSPYILLRCIRTRS